ncbi:MAG TPA: hypothetical protein VE623_14290 [Acidimicrobiales bacterium]|nr:hypothetical protein [Acidimicrobiales bacterium]
MDRVGAGRADADPAVVDRAAPAARAVRGKAAAGRQAPARDRRAPVGGVVEVALPVVAARAVAAPAGAVGPGDVARPRPRV